MSTRPKRTQTGNTDNDDTSGKKPKKGKLYSVFTSKSYVVSKPYENESDAENLKDQLGLMNGDDELDIKEFKDEEEYTTFKDACELKKKENVSTYFISSPVSSKLHNPYAKSPGSLSSIDTKRGGWVKKMIEGDSSNTKPSSLSHDYDSSSMLTTFSENLKKVQSNSPPTDSVIQKQEKQSWPLTCWIASAIANTGVIRLSGLPMFSTKMREEISNQNQASWILFCTNFSR